MRHFLLPSLLLCVLASCTTYQYMTVDSSQVSKNNDTKQFIWQNDTVRLTYRFSGRGGGLTLAVYNKTDQPLYVNWKKSALIRDGQTVSYFDPNLNFYGSGTSVGYQIGRVAVAGSSFSGSVALPEGMDFIPPTAGIVKELPAIWRSGSMVAYVPDSVPKERASSTDGIYYAKFQRMHYDEDQSPIRFKSYLTFSIGSNTGTEFSEAHSFYIREVLQTGASPDQFGMYNPQQGDEVFVKKPAQ